MFAATTAVSFAAPLPDAPAGMVKKEELLTAVHVHPAGAVTWSDSDPPLAPALTAAGFTVTVQLAPAWLSVNTAVPMLIDADRTDDVGLAATEYPTFRFPAPFAPDVTVSHAALLTAVQLVVDEGAVTAAVPVLAPAATLADAGLTANAVGAS